MSHANSTMRVWTGGLLAVMSAALVACSDGGTSPTSPGAARATVRFDYRASTTVSPDLPPSTQVCINGVGRTHIHPSWRNFNRMDMQAVDAGLWQVTLVTSPSPFGSRFV